MSEEGEETPLTATRGVAVYKRRWYILILFSFIAVLQDAVWNTWGPIDHTAKFLYGWSDELIALFANYGSIMYIVAFLPMVYLLERTLRGSLLITSGFIALGTVLRCGFLQDTHVSDQIFTVSCHICAVLNGVANIVVGSAPLAISSAWFPPDERVTATSVAQVANGLGTGMSFLLASQMVRPIDHYIKNHSDPIVPPEVVGGLKDDIQHYMYAQTIPSCVFFVCCVLYFPSAPPLPPSVSSGESRLDFLSGFREVVKSRAAWAIAIGSSIPQGIVIAWTAMMVINLTEVCVGSHCLSQHWVNYLGIYSATVSTLAAILVARLTDKFRAYLKLIILCLLGLATVVFTCLSLISVGAFKFNHLVNVEISVVFLLLLGTSLVVSSMPLSMELAMEACYPAAEGVVGGFISIWFNIISVVFLSILSIPGTGTQWLNYILPISCFVALPIIALVRVEYKRMILDAGPTEEGYERLE